MFIGEQFTSVYIPSAGMYCTIAEDKTGNDYQVWLQLALHPWECRE